MSKLIKTFLEQTILLGLNDFLPIQYDYMNGFVWISIYCQLHELLEYKGIQNKHV